ncbi:hypothetical protein M407DRAFT_6909 [Tulasnella calospora MUT 4182]|uniref:Uncharacterized protein n=1 Tax=Tulasnella calospora MUT 4182 TaxID=1051891 RepID=A0A0C3L329_9AGAM|nr:hypothetical protein M407DRAFT_6909 [Tulasnella calospora MUT 4182]
MTVPKERIELFLKDLAEAPETRFNFDNSSPAPLWTHPVTQWALLFAKKSGTNTRFLEFEFKRAERAHTIVIHTGDEEYSLFQGHHLRTLLAFAVGELCLDQDPRLQLYRFELRRGATVLEDVILKAKASQGVQASGCLKFGGTRGAQSKRSRDYYGGGSLETKKRARLRKRFLPCPVHEAFGGIALCCTSRSALT